MLIGAADQDPVLCLGQDFLGTLVSPYLNFRGTFASRAAMFTKFGKRLNKFQ